MSHRRDGLIVATGTYNTSVWQSYEPWPPPGTTAATITFIASAFLLPDPDEDPDDDDDDEEIL